MLSIPSVRLDICVGLLEAPPVAAAPTGHIELIVSQGHSRASPEPAGIGLAWHGSWNRAGHVRIEQSSGPVRPIARNRHPAADATSFCEASDHEQPQ